MKKITFIIATILLVSCNTITSPVNEKPNPNARDGFGSLSEKPRNSWGYRSYIQYYDDYISIHWLNEIPNSDLPELQEIFKKADVMAQYIYDNITIDIERKDVGKFKGKTIGLSYNYSTETLRIGIVYCDNYIMDACSFGNKNEFQKEGGFTSYLTTKRDLYFKRLNDYNRMSEENQNKLDNL